MTMLMFDKKAAMDIARAQLAIECGCAEGDFLRGDRDNVILPPAFDDRRRKFSDRPFFFRMTTMGGNAVISADERLHGWLREFVREKSGYTLFERSNMRLIDAELARFGCASGDTYHMFLPTGSFEPSRMAAKEFRLETVWFGQEEIGQFYAEGRFPHALSESFLPERPDVLAVAALDGGRIVGMAGCSADTPELWQIGIDVEREYRGQGVATALVSMLRDGIIARGKTPYYGTSVANVRSQHIALKCGFLPAWIDTTA